MNSMQPTQKNDTGETLKVTKAYLYETKHSTTQSLPLVINLGDNSF